MVLRIEYILLISLVIISIFIFAEKPRSIEAIESNTSKEVYFKNFSLLEVDENGVKNQLHAVEATKNKESFYLVDINITYETIHNILAKKATYIRDTIYLESNVLLKRADGFSFWSNDLNYKVKDRIAYTDKTFIIKMNDNKISGTKLRYNLNTEEITADNIHANLEQY